MERHGKLDVVICCAGILRGAMLQADGLDEATFASVIDINVKGTFLTVKAALPHLRKAEQGVVLCMCKMGDGHEIMTFEMGLHYKYISP